MNNMVIGERIRLLRKRNGLTQKELGEKLNIKKESISHYEKNRRCPSIETLIEMCDCLGVDLNYLLGISDIVKSDTKEIRMSDEEVKLIQELRKTKSYRNMISNPINYAKLIDLKTTGYKIEI